uniref:Putative secreted peptide n=1 Tax=Anopheles braziliensis TaxID=58242 RepID=A0A2M3ZPQ7_9DIPT
MRRSSGPRAARFTATCAARALPPSPACGRTPRRSCSCIWACCSSTRPSSATPTASPVMSAARSSSASRP